MQNNYNQHSNAEIQQETRGCRSELPVVDEFMGEQVDLEVAEHETREPEAVVIIGVVADCTKLNVRESPSMDADVVCEISKHTEVMISDSESTDDFYKICTDSGIEGFCMKKFITVHS